MASAPAPRGTAARARLRPAGFDDLGLRRALGDRILPAMVAAMTFLAALALAAVVAAAGLAEHWQRGAGAVVTVQVPQPGAPAADAPQQTRRARVVALAAASPGVASARALSDAEVADLLRPWLGDSALGLSLPLPAVVALRLAPSAPQGALPALSRRLDRAAPGTLTESHAVWVRRLAVLARSLQACAWAALLVVAAVAVAVVAIATRAGLAARRQAIEIVHGLGATDSYIAGRFAARATRLAAAGGLAGALAALPVLLGLAVLAAPFGGTPAAGSSWLAAMPPELWIALPLLPAASAMIGFLTAQGTVRRWLRRLP